MNYEMFFEFMRGSDLVLLKLGGGRRRMCAWVVRSGVAATNESTIDLPLSTTSLQDESLGREEMLCIKRSLRSSRSCSGYEGDEDRS
jgi:hypothetical protein